MELFGVSYNKTPEKEMKQIIPWDTIIAHLEQRANDCEREELDAWLKSEVNEKLYRHLSDLYLDVQLQEKPYDPEIELYWTEMQKRMRKKNEPIRKSYYLRSVKYAAVLLAIIASTYMTYYMTRHAVMQSEFVSQSYESLNGKSKIVLPDGTIVWLNSKSTLSYNYKAEACERRVSLKGEALFDVKKDLQREFVVDVNGASIHVHGTQFNVNSPKNSDELSVALIRGSVSLEANGERTKITPGEKVFYSRSNKSIIVEKADTEIETLWAASRICLKDKTLTEICRYFEKWYGVQIELSPKITNKQSYSFTITDESLEEILRLMARIHPMSFYFGENNTLFINYL